MSKKHPNRIKEGSRLADIIIYIVVVLLGLMTLYPVVFVISNSISDPVASATGQVWLWPVGFSTAAFEYVFQSPALWRAFFNSVIYTVIITAGQLFFDMLVAFGLSKKGLVGRKWIVLFILIPLWFSAGLIPIFINMTKLGLYDSIFSVLLMSMFGIYNCILARSFINRLPHELLEAATIDGASVPHMFFKIVLPLSKPIMAVLGLYIALGAWNNWYSYMIYLPTRSELHPLQYFLVKTLIQAQSSVGGLGMTMEQTMEMLKLQYILPQLKYAMIVVAIVPIMCVYPFAQKYFVKGVMLGSLKE
jgi:putative aldouronate transport system permease protein